MRNTLLATAMAAAASIAVAHDGHGLEGPHGHATDVFGYVLLALLVAGAVWWARRK